MEFWKRNQMCFHVSNERSACEVKYIRLWQVEVIKTTSGLKCLSLPTMAKEETPGRIESDHRKSKEGQDLAALF